MPGITILGKELFAKDEAGKLISRIGTVFPHHQAIVTERGPHAWQRGRFINWLNERRQKAAQPPLDRAEESAVWNGAVDLIIDGDTVLIRPDPENLPLAFEADALLQKRVPKYRIRLLGVLNEKIRVALKHRGECWRMTPLPMSRGTGGTDPGDENRHPRTRDLLLQRDHGHPPPDLPGVRRPGSPGRRPATPGTAGDSRVLRQAECLSPAGDRVLPGGRQLRRGLAGGARLRLDGRRAASRRLRGFCGAGSSRRFRRSSARTPPTTPPGRNACSPR